MNEKLPNSHKKYNENSDTPCNKTQPIIESETLCQCVHKSVVPTKVKKDRELLEGVIEYLIFRY